MMMMMDLNFSQQFQSACKYGSEILFLSLFASVTTINKFVLSELKFTVPTVFQGWQTLSCVLLLSVLIKFKKVNNDLQILDGKTLLLLLPALFCFALGIVAGSKALAELHVPVFLAITNLYFAVLIFLGKKKEPSKASLNVCGSTAVLGTVVIIVMFTWTTKTASPFLWLFGHILLNLFYYLYLKKLNLDLTNTTQIYYKNFFSVILLFPISVYLDVLHLPEDRDWKFYVGCFLSGVLGSLLQMWTFKMSVKPNFLQFVGLAQIICSLIAYKIFFTEIDQVVWVLIILNFLICATFLKNNEVAIENVKLKIDLFRPPSNEENIESDMIPLV